MHIFLKRLPTGTRRSDIEDFIAGAVKGGLFSRSGEVKSIVIIERRNPQLNITDYHGVVSIEPDSVAERVIKKLNRKKFKDKYIEVRRYYFRKSNNDARKNNQTFDEDAEVRRVEERRRIQESTEPNFAAIKSFHRKG